MRSAIAFAFRLLFKLNFFKKKFFGFYKNIFFPLTLFKGIKKKCIYRKKIFLELELDDWLSQNIYFLNEYEEPEIKFIEQYLTEGDYFIDIGANIGLYSLVAATLVKNKGKVYSFEPYNKNFNRISNHIRINRLTNVVLEKLAIADLPGKITLFLNEKEKNNGMVSAYANDYTASEVVSSVSIDSYLKNEKNIPLKFIKIDIEGGEYLALKGMEEILKEYHPVLLVEQNPDINEQIPFSQKQIDDYLIKLGYQKKFLNKNGNLQNQRFPGNKSTNSIFIFNQEPK